jgi:type I restriction enzyme S subunit
MEPPGIITGRSGVIGNVYLSLKKYWPLNTTLYVRQFRACGPYYAYHLLKSLDLKALNSGSAVPSLNRNFVHSTDTIKPNSELLAKFEHTVGSFFQEIVGNIDQNESLGKTRDTLLPMLLSGELTIPNAENRVAEAKETTDV